MNVLIIDNGTKHLAELEQLLIGHVVTVVSFNTIILEEVEQYDLVVLSGAPVLSVIGNEEIYSKEIELIKNCTKPIVGICLGFELIAHAFGASLQRMDVKVEGLADIEILQENLIFANILNVKDRRLKPAASTSTCKGRSLTLTDSAAEPPLRKRRDTCCFKVYEAHRWIVKTLPECLIGLARSKDGFEIVKHKDKKIYGLQFHPEMFVESTCGAEIFGNLLSLV